VSNPAHSDRSDHLPGDRFLAYLELVRLPNLFTAMADVAMGVLFVQQTSQLGATEACVLGLLVAASTSLYAGGVVLNDVFDFEQDAKDRPDRPLPSGRVSRKTACQLGWGLLLVGELLTLPVALLVGHVWPVVVGGLLAVCIGLYDAYLRRTPLGPIAMGGCRMLNVLLGMSVAAGAWQTQHWLVAGGIGTYIVGVTWFARTETGRSSRLSLGLGTGVMMLGIGLLAQLPAYADNLVVLLQRQPQRWHLLMSVLGVLIGWRCLRAAMDPIPGRVQTAVKHCILSLVILDAAVCYAARGTFWAVMILLLLAPAMFLGRWMYST